MERTTLPTDDFGMEILEASEDSIQWKPFPGFESDYLISSNGDVWSIRNMKILRPKITATGYVRVSPSVNGHRKDCAVHRMVALAFIPNPDNKPTVNHINEDKTDNRVKNLEWATIMEQNIHGTRIARAIAHTDYKNRAINYTVVASKHNYHEINRKQMKAVLQYDVHGRLLGRYPGLGVAARCVGVHAGHLCQCLKGERRQCGGYKWEYE